MTEITKDNIKDRAVISEGGCWLWAGAIRKAPNPNHCYGWVAYKNTQMNAHRLAWILFNGEIPNGLVVQHKCESPSCINPEHLFVGPRVAVANHNLTPIVSHGMSESREYKIWANMRYRCGNPNVSSYSNYGGRGIKVCERWQSFAAFFEDMGPSPEGFTIERINNDGDYEPSNCQWISRANQVRNRRITPKFNGKSIGQIADETGQLYSTLLRRLRKYGDPMGSRKVESKNV